MSFDPYHKWLGIAPRDQPPTHYRLLAIDLFESDPDVIDAAADRQMAYLRQCAAGPHVAESQRLLNEVAAARLCLLSPSKKKAYDATLGEGSGGESRAARPSAVRVVNPGAPAQAARIESTAIDGINIQTTEDRSRRTLPRTKPYWRNWRLQAGAAAVLAVCAAYYLRAGTSSTEKTLRGKGTGASSASAEKSGPVKKKPPPEALSNSIGMELVLIPAGEFDMGTPSTESRYGEDDERPSHRVRITKPFYLGRVEVRQRDYAAVMGTNPGFPTNPTNPINNVSTADAEELCRKLSKIEKRKYRLPTEAEWEYACRAGTSSQWYFGDKNEALDRHAWLARNSGGGIQPVGQLSPNPFGLFDMYGNVAEWCSDWYLSNRYKIAPSPDLDPVGPLDSSFRSQTMTRVIRGGSFYSDGPKCRSAFRGAATATARMPSTGFRVVLEMAQ